jgi:exopolysaccharide production protein ExoQ
VGTSERQKPVYLYIISWLIVIPLIYYCMHGSPFFQHESTNNIIGAHLGNIAAEGNVSSTVSRAQNIGIFLLTAALMLPCFRALLRDAQRYPVIVLLPVFAIVSVLWSAMPGRSVYLGLLLLGNAFFSFYLAERFHPNDWMRLVRFAGFFIVFGSILVCLFLPKYGIDIKEGGRDWQGVFTQKNSCAIVTCYMLAPALFLKSKTRLERVFNVVYIAAAIFLIAMSQSRTGWLLCLCLLAATAAMHLVVRFAASERRTIALTLATSAALLVLVLVIALPILLEAVGKDPTMTGRTQIWSLCMVAIARHPILGYGFKAFWNGFQGPGAFISYALDNLISHAQSGFLDTWLETGIIGLLLTLYLFYQAFRSGWQIVTTADAYQKFCIAVVLITFVSNLDERSANYPDFIEWIMFMVAYIALRSSTRTEPAEARAFSRV